MVSSRQNSVLGNKPSSNYCGSGVEGTAIVSNSAGNAVQLQYLWKFPDNREQSSDGVPTTSGCVIYLWSSKVQTFQTKLKGSSSRSKMS